MGVWLFLDSLRACVLNETRSWSKKDWSFLEQLTAASLDLGRDGVVEVRLRGRSVLDMNDRSDKMTVFPVLPAAACCEPPGLLEPTERTFPRITSRSSAVRNVAGSYR